MKRYSDFSIVCMLLVMVGILTYGCGTLAAEVFTTDNGYYGESK